METSARIFSLFKALVSKSDTSDWVFQSENGLYQGILLGYRMTMNLIDAASFKSLVDKDISLLTILFVKAKESDEHPRNLEQTEIGKTLSSYITFLDLESVQNGLLPDLDKEKPLYLLCDHGHISELTALYLELAGFETFNVEGGLQALEVI